MFLGRTEQGGCRRYLSHRSMKRRVPACVISGVTGAAGVRRHVITSARLNRSILRGLHFAVEIAQRNEGEHGGAGDSRDDGQPMPDGSRQARHNSTRISSDDRKNGKRRQTVFVRSSNSELLVAICSLKSTICNSLWGLSSVGSASMALRRSGVRIP